MTFTIRKTKDVIEVDLEKIHSTSELHFFNELNHDKCFQCNKEFKNGDECGIVELGGSLHVIHIICR